MPIIISKGVYILSNYRNIISGYLTILVGGILKLMNPGPAGIPQLEYIFSRIVCISVPLGFTVLLVILIIAGIKYLMSAGEPKAISQAHQTVTWGLLGVVFLAISWLILLLIQNFTGIQVTKFTLSSLPGVQGFTGSCWEEAPVAPSNQSNPVVSEPPKLITSQIPANVTANSICNAAYGPTGADTFPISNKIDGFPFPVHICLMSCRNPDEYLVPSYAFTPTYVDSNNIVKLSTVIEQPILVNILADAASTQLFQAGGNRRFDLGGNGILIARLLGPAAAEKQTFFGEFYKNSIPKNFIQAKYDAQQMAKKWDIQQRGYTQDLGSGSLDEVKIYGLSCDNYNYLAITTVSPLIYLYPSVVTNIKLSINSSVISPLKQEENSWNILANRDGAFEKNGRSYRYIPYEFLRRDFKRPEKGVVVSADKLVEYLRGNLWRKLGLTDSEIEDYWQDIGWRIPKSNYYFVSLIDRSEIDRVLPMEINPKPDTIIRNMTYILPLEKPFIPIPLQEIKAPQRNGFTVVENGGFIDGF